MAIFLDHEVRFPKSGSYKHELLCWNPKRNILAVGSNLEGGGGEVNFFLEEGEASTEKALVKVSHRVSSLAWHPDKQMIAAGWSNGEVLIWNQGDQFEPFSVAGVAKVEITHLTWSSNGSRLLVADAASTVLVYKIDHRGEAHTSPFAKNTLSEPVVSVLLKPPPLPKAPPSSGKGVATLGVAQLEDGDALDLFSRSRTGHESFYVSLGSSDSGTFFIGGASGGVFCLRDSGTLVECFTADRPIIKLLYLETRNVLVTVSEDLMLHQHSVSPDGKTKLILKAKLSEKLTHFQLIWTLPGVLAMSSGESKIRLWDLENEENCLLRLASDHSDSILSLAYSPHRGLLAAGTGQNKVGLWRYSKGGEDADMEAEWKGVNPLLFSSPVHSLDWAQGRSLLAVATTNKVYIVKEQEMLAHYKSKVSVVQKGRSTLSLCRVKGLGTEVQDVETDMHIKGCSTSDSHLTIWDTRRVDVFEILDSGTPLVGSFQCSPLSAVVLGQNVYVAESGKVQVRTFQGTVKQQILPGEEEGSPFLLDAMGQFLVVGTTRGWVRIFDLSRREAKQQFHPKNLAEGVPDFGSIVSLQINSQGNKASYIIRSSHGLINPKFFVWDAETDAVNFFNFATGLSDQLELEGTQDMKQSDHRFRHELSGKVPEMHCWDSKDPRLLLVQVETTEAKEEPKVVSFFVTSDHGILVQDAAPRSPSAQRLLGVDIPFLYFTRKRDEEGDGERDPTEKVLSRFVVRRVGREFVGMEDAPAEMREAMLNFSFHLTVGNMDEAFKAIKLIKSEAVWENMAHMCVKTQRLDVAGVCLGNMGHARGARQLRKVIREESQPEVHVACLAVQLGLIDDAIRLYQSCGRMDLLNKLYQSKNSWKQAVELAQTEDRIHMRNTYYLYAGHLESVGAVDGAIENYELSETQRFEVPRMLFDNPLVLEKYVRKNADAYLQKWWAQYLESLGELEAARSYYQEARDFLSVVRICCYMNDVQEAGRVASESEDAAACYHLARQYEIAGDFRPAVDFFVKAQAYASAIRLAKEHGMSEQVAHLSLMGSEGDMIEAAKFYENQPGQTDKAVLLYHKAGMFGRALDLAFRTDQFSALDLIAGDLDENSDPRVLERCAEFFLKNQQYTKAIQLLAYAKQYKRGIELCVQKNVPISEELVELLTPTKESFPNNVERNALLEQLGDFCMQQGHYHYAAKKYTQAGSKTEAMRALLKSGDTAKIISFANIARNKDIYIIAANYLQTVNWKSEPEIMKQIVNFYTKGGAPLLLAGFYHACAEVEIDDYRDYEKALHAVQEAGRCLAKAEGKDALQIQERLEALNRQATLIKKFLSIRSVYEVDPAEAMKQLQVLASTPEIGDSVRLGDIYAVLIIHNVKKENFKKAHSYLEELRKKIPSGQLSRFVKPQIIETVYHELNLPPPKAVLAVESDEGEVQESLALRRNQEHNEIVANGE